MAGTVIVGNVRKPEQVPEGFTRIYVGRHHSKHRKHGEDFSVLGNPYALHHGYSREDAIDLYRTWLHNQDPIGGVGQAAVALKSRLLAGENLALMCFCHPQACHADVIKDILEVQP